MNDFLTDQPEFDDLQARINKTKKADKSKLEGQLNELKANRADAQKKLDAAKDTTAESWKSVKADLEKAKNDIVTAYKKIVAEIK